MVEYNVYLQSSVAHPGHGRLGRWKGMNHTNGLQVIRRSWDLHL